MSNGLVIREMTRDEYLAEGLRLFGEDMMTWKFVCPSCGCVASVADYKMAGAPEGAIGFSCIGRWMGDGIQDAFAKGPGPCNYAGGGLIRIAPIKILDDLGSDPYYFDFARSAGQS